MRPDCETRSGLRVDSGLKVDSGLEIDFGLQIDPDWEVDSGLEIHSGSKVDAGPRVDAGLEPLAGSKIDLADSGLEGQAHSREAHMSRPQLGRALRWSTGSLFYDEEGTLWMMIGLCGYGWRVSTCAEQKTEVCKRVASATRF
jgi:hypothetical protein